MNVRCVTYVSKFSAGNCGYEDLMIGVKHGVVGCGSKVFNSSNPGDLVLISATLNKTRHAVIGVLCEKIESCDAWQKEGGIVWPYNWTYEPITTTFVYDESTKEEVQQIAEEHALNPHMLFNPRFCSKKMRPILDRLIEKFRL
jgi:hypothetical protein